MFDMDTTTRIAFLGLGAMGTPMARRALAAGYPLTAWNRSPLRAAPLAAQGAKVADSPAEAVRDADVVVSMLTDPAAVLEVVARAAPALRPGTTWIEASTIGPAAVRSVAAYLPPGVTLVDAPVLGSVDRAAAGELALMVGGDADEVMPLLQAFGRVTRTGPIGSGAALKLVLINGIVNGVAVIAEAMALADRLGLPEELVKTAMAASPLAGIAGRAFAEGAFYAIPLAAKDVGLAVETGARGMDVARAVYGYLTGTEGVDDRDLGELVGMVRRG